MKLRLPIIVLAPLIVSVAAIAAPSLDDCRSWPRMHALDFWLGQWNVSAGGQTVGTNRIETILNGCAVTEQWLDGRGGRGQSLFYYDRAMDRWKQVWLTDHALTRGGTKEKTEQVERTSSERIVFQGRYLDPESGAAITDRTTLAKRSDGTVQQLIEISTDEGKTWRTTFDGIYRARPSD
jgi:hypothetical protein